MVELKGIELVEASVGSLALITTPNTGAVKKGSTDILKAYRYGAYGSRLRFGLT